MKKKLLFLFAAILLSMACAFAQGGTTGPLTWEITGEYGDFTLTISGNGAMPDYDYSNELAPPWSEYVWGISKIIIGHGVLNIGSSSFRWCESLSSIDISNSVTTIGEEAFFRCENLESITLPSSVTTIGGGAFQLCRSLVSITLSNGLKTIGNNAFVSCNALTSIILPNSVTTIGGGAFSFCEALTSITLPSSITTIGSLAFGFCDILSSIIILNLIPIEPSDEIFTTGPITITVPTSAVLAYQNAIPWQWHNIVGSGILVNPISENIEYGYTKGDALYQINETATVTAISRNGYKFVNWTKDGSSASTDNPFSFTVTEDIELVANFEEGVRIETFATPTIHIYPNPTTGELKIESGELIISKIEIIDFLGRKQIIGIESLLSAESKINISHLPAGVYFVKISTEAGEIVKKVLKE